MFQKPTFRSSLGYTRYDLADRLDSVTYPDQSVAYDYDRVGNRQAEAIIPAAGDAFSKTYGYNTRDQLESIQHSLDPAETVIYTYDVNGNQLSKTKNGTVTSFVVNSRNQIARIEENGLPIGAYGYDYQGLRVRKYTDHEVRYLYDDQSVLQREDANVGTIHYEYGPDRLLSVVHPSEGRSFYLHDALGSIVAMTGPGASLMGQYSYDAWGNYRHKIENDSNIFGFTGHEMDGESGLVYARARFYDPEVGRFLSHDPLEGDANNPPSLHRYLYVQSRPTTGIDPDGRERVEIEPLSKAERKIQKRYRDAYEKFKATSLGAAAAKRLEAEQSFKLEVRYDGSYTNGLVVGAYEFGEEGNLEKAVLTVGPNFGKRVKDDLSSDYPFGVTLTKRDELLIYTVGHEEQGHAMLAVEDPEYLAILIEKEKLNEPIRRAAAEAKETFPNDRKAELREYQRLFRERELSKLRPRAEALGSRLEVKSDARGQSFVKAHRNSKKDTKNEG